LTCTVMQIFQLWLWHRSFGQNTAAL